MPERALMSSLALLVLGWACASAAAYAWRERTILGHKSLAAILACVALWNLANAAQLASTTLETMMIWDMLAMPGIIALPFAWLSYVLRYAGYDRIAANRFLRFASVPGIASLVLVLTNPFHQLAWAKSARVPTAWFVTLDNEYGSLAYVIIGYSALMILVGEVIMARLFRWARPPFRTQLGLLLAISPVPLVLTVADMLDLAGVPGMQLSGALTAGLCLVASASLIQVRRNSLIAARNATVLASSGDAVIQLGRFGEITDLNAAARSLLADPEGDTIGISLNRIRPHWAEGVGRLQSGEIDRCELAAQTAKGERLYDARLSPLPDVTAHTANYALVLRDVTERARAEADLRRSEARFRSLVEGSPDAIVLVDLEGDILMGNRQAALLSGVQGIQDLIGRNVMDFIASEERERMLLFIEGLLETGGATRAVVQGRRVDGSAVPMDVSTSLVPGESGESPSLVAILRDVSERQELEAQLRQAQKMEAIGRLAGGIAHDFNNLLVAILGYSDFLMEGLGQDSPLRRDVQEIQKAGERAASLTRQLLAFGRKQLLQPRLLDLGELVADTEGMLRRLIGQDVRLHCSSQPDLWPVTADPVQITQVLLNLVVNSRDAMPDGGMLRIATENVRAHQERAFPGSELGPGDYVVLSVTDSGVGMAEEVIAHLFEPFFTTKDVGKGTGLGLAMAYGIARQSDGDIAVESEPGKGSTFRLFLPRARVGAEAGARESVLAFTPTGSETILLVEDDAIVRTAVAAGLRRSGYTVLEAGGPEEALGLVGQLGAVDLILTDVVMPGMNGYELASRLTTACPGLKVLYMSGYADDAGTPASGSGVPFIQKPFSVSQLASKMREVLAGGQPVRSGVHGAVAQS